MAPSKPDQSQPADQSQPVEKAQPVVITDIRIFRVRTLRDRIRLAQMPVFRRNQPPCSDEMQFGQKRRKIANPAIGLSDPPDKS
jgi:hypothetical protein